MGQNALRSKLVKFSNVTFYACFVENTIVTSIFFRCFMCAFFSLSGDTKDGIFDDLKMMCKYTNKSQLQMGPHAKGDRWSVRSFLTSTVSARGCLLNMLVGVFPSHTPNVETWRDTYLKAKQEGRDVVTAPCADKLHGYSYRNNLPAIQYMGETSPILLKYAREGKSTSHVPTQNLHLVAKYPLFAKMMEVCFLGLFWLVSYFSVRICLGNNVYFSIFKYLYLFSATLSSAMQGWFRLFSKERQSRTVGSGMWLCQTKCKWKQSTS